MSAAPDHIERNAAESTAVKLLEFGFWAIPLYAAGVTRKSGQITKGKEPYGSAWGAIKNTPESLREAYGRMPNAGVGICLGPDRSPGGGWLIDLEGDGPIAKDSLASLFDGEIVDTVGWDSFRGSHSLFVASPGFLELLKSAGASEGTGLKSGVWKLADYPDLEFRIGGYKPDGTVKQVQSACPPTVGEDGNPRTWNGVKTLAALPKAAIENLRRIAETNPFQVETKPEPVVIPMRRASDDDRRGDPVKRASAWLSKADPAVSGEHGHDKALFVASRLVHGFDLGIDGARPLYYGWNRTCQPPWSEAELEHKLTEAARIAHDKPAGHMLEEDRPGWKPPARSAASVESSVSPDIAAAVDEEIENIEVVDHWPKVNPAMFRGVAGEFVQRIAPETEADPVATLFQILAGFGNMVGRGPHFVVGSTEHYCVLDIAVVGATAVGRKGSSGDDAKFLLKNVDPQWATTRCRRGLSTGEGLTQNVRDPKYRSPTKDEIKKGASPEDIVCEDEGVSDKRLHVIETEMGKLLKVMNRDTNTLSEVLRQTWDGEDLGNLSKNSGCTATAPHITVVGHVTKADITKCLTETDMSNGFANRFLWVMARRSKELPDGGNMFDLDLSDLYERARRAREFAVSLGKHRMTFDAEFRKVWRDIYHELSSDQRHVVASRSEAYVKRIACTLALLDATDVVGIEHLKTAVAMWDYVDESIRFVFGAAVKDPNEAKLIDALKAAPGGLTRKEINHDVFRGHLKAKAIADVLGRLLTRGAIHAKTENTGRGRPAERWCLGRSPGCAVQPLS